MSVSQVCVFVFDLNIIEVGVGRLTAVAAAQQELGISGSQSVYVSGPGTEDAAGRRVVEDQIHIRTVPAGTVIDLELRREPVSAFEIVLRIGRITVRRVDRSDLLAVPVKTDLVFLIDRVPDAERTGK